MFITAIVLALIQLRWTEQYTPGDRANLLYGALTFFSVVAVYCLDHLFDLVKYEKFHSDVARFRWLNILFTLVSALILALLVSLFFTWLDFEHSWIPLLPVVLYCFVALKVIPTFRGLKELVIAITVAVALVYPFFGSKPEMAIRLGVPAFVVCLMNLLIFGMFEKRKDEVYGFQTIYTDKSDLYVYRHMVRTFLVCSIVILALMLVSGISQWPFAAIATGFWLMLLFQSLLRDHPVYRWIADGLLLLMILV